METKTQKAISAFQSGQFKIAFGIFSKFHGFSKDEKRSIQIAYECLTGKESFYISLGVDTLEITKIAIEIISARYCSK